MTRSLYTPLCDLLGIRYPILCAPMGWITGPELTAAVSNAGGLGIMGAGAFAPEALRARIRQVRALTDKPFGVNLILSRPAEDARAGVLGRTRSAAVACSGGIPRPMSSAPTSKE